MPTWIPPTLTIVLIVAYGYHFFRMRTDGFRDAVTMWQTTALTLFSTGIIVGVVVFDIARGQVWTWVALELVLVAVVLACLAQSIVLLRVARAVALERDLS